MMNKEFVPYEEALALKELGFDESCFSYYNTTDNELSFVYDGHNRISFRRNSQFGFACSAPLYQQAFRWFREEHDLSHSIVEHEDKYSYSTNCGDFKIVGTYEEAELECLRKLIEIVKENKDE